MKFLRILVLLLIAALAGAFIWLAVQGDLQALILEQVQNSELNTWLVVAALSMLILLSTLSGLPVLYYAMALGFLLPPALALLISLGVNLLSVMAAFFMVRLLFRDYFQKRYGEKKLIKSINKRVRKYGLWTVVFSRGIYMIPTNLINFSFPLSKIRPPAYLLGTTLGLLPETLINVFTGYLIKHQLILMNSPEGKTWQVLVIGAFILIAVLAFTGLRLWRRRHRGKGLLEDVVPYEE